MRSPIFLFMALVLGAASSAAVAAEIRGKVSRVEDGDTLVVIEGRHELRVRLHSIDAPELDQPFGKASRKSLAALCTGKPVRVTGLHREPGQAAIGRVSCGRTDASAHQVRAGMAWMYVRYADPDSPLYRLEYEARLKHRGLWSDQRPTAPWDWRRRTSAMR
jgi:endonuclease YncB( thermonuclease family)